MDIIFDQNGRVTHCNYWESTDCANAMVRVAVMKNHWHLFVPEPPLCGEGGSRALVMPVTAKQEEAGWLWRLTIEGTLDLRLPLTAFVGAPEPLPDSGTNRDDCWLCIYRPVAGDVVEMVRQLKLVVYRQRRRRQTRPPIVAKPSSPGDPG